ncbi:MAG: type II CRISPR-associated endonuclease Cas1 [Armatimonadetes bacterium]|nr:type II CRISPR-associated endonuclease Cas1 [Armatimonadota bacterium]
MKFRVVSVTGPGALGIRDNGLRIERAGAEVAKIPIEDIAVVVLDGPDITLSHQVLSVCAEHGVALISADDRRLPNGILLPLAGHTLHTSTLRLQIEASKPNAKRAWQRIIRAKILAQASHLEHWNLPSDDMRKMAAMVRSGDPDNLEARSAARYFGTLFGPDFVRDRESVGLNAFLNYGYAVLRAAVARAVVGAGLHPAIGIFHRSQYNALCLADDAMEPLRPLVDALAKNLVLRGLGEESITPQIKRELIAILGATVDFEGSQFPLMVGLERYAASLRRSICEGEDLSVPIPLFSP